MENVGGSWNDGGRKLEGREVRCRAARSVDTRNVIAGYWDRLVCVEVIEGGLICYKITKIEQQTWEARV